MSAPAREIRANHLQYVPQDLSLVSIRATVSGACSITDFFRKTQAPVELVRKGDFTHRAAPEKTGAIPELDSGF
jgi:hypothetical protein